MPAPPAYRPLPLSRGMRDRRAMRGHRVFARNNSFVAAAAPVTFTDTQSGALVLGGTRSEGATFSNTGTGALIFGGSLTGEGPILFTPPHGRRLPLSRGLRDRQSMRRYARNNSFVAAAPVTFTDARTGALILGGTRSEGTTFSSTRSGALIFGGTASLASLFHDTRSGALVLGGSSSETYTPPAVAAAVKWTTIGTFIKVQ